VLSSVRRCLEVFSRCDMLEHVDDLEEFVENKLLENSVRKKTTDFFKKN
jgi:hypothetical protein